MVPVDINKLIDRVVSEKIEIQVTMEPDRTEITIQPWKPYEIKWPYGMESKEG